MQAQRQAVSADRRNPALERYLDFADRAKRLNLDQEKKGDQIQFR